ncbi:protein jim lovell [Culex quinquefasciatus]|uniref:protein jim lovell n=1 Tax=Culex quinquefasciatus TaxID=7176 RepID=UPI0018E29C35|nr:protein jim lovell [Culex quinquefasciatus]
MREKFEIMTDQEHYSLRWNNHQNHILRAFDTLLQTKTLVDVTLVCAETSIRAHKVVLSACSPFFQRVFSETPCKHPVIVLKDFRGWVVQAIVDFMYRGEISVPQERLSVLIQAGESLQVRGLVDHPVAGNTPTPAQSPEDFSLLDSSLISPTSPALSSPNFSHHQHRNQNSTATGLLSSSTPKLLLPPQVFADPTLNLPNPDICTSPMPRRKQARPRRRSGDCGPQDLSSKPTSPVPPMQDKEEEDDNEMDRDEEEEDEDDDIKEILRRSESDEKPEEKTPSKASEHNEKDKNNSTASTATLEGPENLCLKKSSSTSSPGSSSSPGNNSASKDASPASLKEDSPQSQIGRLSLKDIRHLNRVPLVRSMSSLSPPPSFHLNNNPPPPHLSHLPPEKRVKLEDDDRLTADDEPGHHFLDHMDLALASHQHPLAHLSHHVRNSSPHSLRPPGLTPDHPGEANNNSKQQQRGGDGGHPNNGRGSDSGPLEERNLRKERHQHGGPKDFLHSPTLNFPPFFNQSDGGPHPRPPHSPLSSFPHMSSVSSLTLTPPHMFSLDSPLGLFPPGMDLGKNYSPLMEMSDPRGMHHDGPPFLKHKKMNRPKGQHSAPRGGPPRSWTNAELTEALQHVWNKKMTTSQASRIFGIPYNSLLMYVRGKYGKSLKLEQLRKDCISGPPIELLQMGMNNNGGSGKDKKEGSDKDQGSDGRSASSNNGGPDQRGGPRSASSEPELLSSPNPLFNPFPPGFYPDFPGGFPGLPLSMLNLLPPDRHAPPHHQLPLGIDEDCKSDRSKQSLDDDFPQPLALNRGSGLEAGPRDADSRREIYQQNGQD